MFSRIRRIFVAGAMLMAAGAAPAWAQPANAPVDWSGFYAGVFAGYSLDKDAATSSSTGPVSETNVHNNGDVDVVTIFQGAANSRISTVSGGGRVGYDYQDGALVLGTFASLNLGNFGKNNNTDFSESATRNGAPLGAIAQDEQDSFDLNWYGSVEGKMGVAVDNWLFYAKGGVAFADVSASTTSSVTASGTAAGDGFPAGTTSSTSGTSQFLVGGTIGAGAAIKLTDKLSANLEYSYVALPSLSVSGAGLGGILGGDGGSTTSFGAQFHTIRAGIDYHF